MRLALPLLFLAACSSTEAGTPGDAGTKDSGSTDAASLDAAPDAAPIGTATVTGTVAGLSLAPKDAVAIVTSGQSGAELRATIVVTIRDVTPICSELVGGRATPRTTALTLTVELSNPHTQPTIGTLTYDLSAQQDTGGNYLRVVGRFSKGDDFCQESLADAVRSAATGTITFTAISPTEIRGSFTLTFTGTDALSGTFSAPRCAVDPATLPARPVCR